MIRQTLLLLAMLPFPIASAADPEYVEWRHHIFQTADADGVWGPFNTLIVSPHNSTVVSRDSLLLVSWELTYQGDNLVTKRYVGNIRINGTSIGDCLIDVRTAAGQVGPFKDSGSLICHNTTGIVPGLKRVQVENLAAGANPVIDSHFTITLLQREAIMLVNEMRVTFELFAPLVVFAFIAAWAEMRRDMFLYAFSMLAGIVAIIAVWEEIEVVRVLIAGTVLLLAYRAFITWQEGKPDED